MKLSNEMMVKLETSKKRAVTASEILEYNGNLTRKCDCQIDKELEDIGLTKDQKIKIVNAFSEALVAYATISEHLSAVLCVQVIAHLHNSAFKDDILNKTVIEES